MGIAPGMRSPSSKKIVGVPLIFLSRPKATTFSMGVSQFAAPEGTASLSMRSSHALERSGEHHTAFDFCVESGERIGYRNVYTVMSLTPTSSRSKRLQ